MDAQPVDPDLTAKLLGRGVAVSPIVTVEPRRRKFHKAITLSMPAPKAHSQGMINQYSGNTPTLRLLCSITEKQIRKKKEKLLEVKDKSQEVVQTAHEIVSETVETASKKVENIISAFETKKPENGLAEPLATKSTSKIIDETAERIQDSIIADQKSAADAVKSFSETKVDETKEFLLTESESVKDKIKAFTEPKIAEAKDTSSQFAQGVGKAKEFIENESSSAAESVKSGASQVQDKLSAGFDKLGQMFAGAKKTVESEVKETSETIETKANETKSETKEKIEQGIAGTKDFIVTETKTVTETIKTFSEPVKIEEKLTEAKDSVKTEANNVADAIKSFTDKAGAAIDGVQSKIKKEQVVASDKIDQTIADFEAKKVTYEFRGLEPKVTPTTTSLEQEPTSVPEAAPRKTVSTLDDSREKLEEMKSIVADARKLTRDFLSMEQESQLPKPRSDIVEETKQIEKTTVETITFPPVVETTIKEGNDLLMKGSETLHTAKQQIDKHVDEAKQIVDDGIEIAAPITKPEITTSSVKTLTQDFLSFEQAGPMHVTSSSEPRKSLTDAEFCKSVEETITKKMSEGLIEISEQLKLEESDIPHSQTPPPTPIETKNEKSEYAEGTQKATIDEDNLIDTVKTLHKTTESTFERITTISTTEHISIQTVKPFAYTSSVKSHSFFESKKLPAEMLDTKRSTPPTAFPQTKDTPSFTEMSESSQLRRPDAQPPTTASASKNDGDLPSAVEASVTTIIADKEPALSDREYLEKIMKCGDVKRKIQELETQRQRQDNVPTGSKTNQLESEADKSASVKDAIHAMEEKLVSTTVEAVPFAVRRRDSLRAECDLPVLERQILSEIDVQLVQLTKAEPEITVVKQSPIEAMEKQFEQLQTIDEPVCEKICQKKKAFEVADGRVVTDTLDLEIGVHNKTEVVEETLPKVKEVVESFEKKKPTSSTLEAIPFSPRKRDVRPNIEVDLVAVEKHILTETDVLLESLAPVPSKEAVVKIQPLQSPQDSTGMPIEEACEIKCSKRRISELAKLFEGQKQTQEYASEARADQNLSDTKEIETEKTAQDSQLKETITSTISLDKPLDNRKTEVDRVISQSTADTQKHSCDDTEMNKLSVSKDMWDNTQRIFEASPSDFFEVCEITTDGFAKTRQIQHPDFRRSAETESRANEKQPLKDHPFLSKTAVETFSFIDDVTDVSQTKLPSVAQYEEEKNTVSKVKREIYRYESQVTKSHDKQMPRSPFTIDTKERTRTGTTNKLSDSNLRKDRIDSELSLQGRIGIFETGDDNTVITKHEIKGEMVKDLSFVGPVFTKQTPVPSHSTVTTEEKQGHSSSVVEETITSSTTNKSAFGPDIDTEDKTIVPSILKSKTILEEEVRISGRQDFYGSSETNSRVQLTREVDKENKSEKGHIYRVTETTYSPVKPGHPLYLTTEPDDVISHSIEKSIGEMGSTISKKTATLTTTALSQKSELSILTRTTTDFTHAYEEQERRGETAGTTKILVPMSQPKLPSATEKKQEDIQLTDHQSIQTLSLKQETNLLTSASKKSFPTAAEKGGASDISDAIASGKGVFAPYSDKETEDDDDRKVPEVKEDKPVPSLPMKPTDPLTTTTKPGVPIDSGKGGVTPYSDEESE
uniref:Uncharacterized protein n=1 Tax=Musca domestica TaxID=7370 RepID=A0A1I8ME34_MUSDO